MSSLYRDIIEYMQSGVAAFRAVRDPMSNEIIDFEWILSNAYGEKISGRPEAELLGKRVLDELPDHGPNGLFARFCQVVETGEPDEFVLPYPENLSHGVYDLRMFKVGDGFAIAFTTITEQFEQRRAYEALANRFSIATRSAGIGVWEHEIETGRRDWDATTTRLFGHEPGVTVTAEMAVQAIHPEDRDRVATIMQATVAGAPDSPDAGFSERFRVVWADGSVHHLQSHAQLVQGERGRRVIGVAWDVTDEVRSAAELDIKRREAESANIAKSQFLASMSHEIRTPLNGVLGMASALAQTALDERQRQMLSTIVQSGDELLEILNGILDLSRIESGRLEIEETTFNFGHLLSAANSLFAPQAAEKGLSFRIEAGAEVDASFLSDPTRIRQVLYNLLSNALKFTAKGEVVLSAEVAEAPDGDGGDRMLTLSVRDTGIGISADKVDRIFQPFTQADGSTTRLFGGTGLGLTIASQLASLLGGSVTVSSTEGQGSTFVAQFRVKAASAPKTVEAPRLHASVGGGERPIRVLVAEDNAVNQMVICELLKPLRAETTIAANGQEAVDAWAGSSFDLILMDINMPVMDGLAASVEIRRLESESCCPPTPIIAVTANAMSHHVERYLDAGFDGHIAKPIKPLDFVRVIANALAARSAHGTPRGRRRELAPPRPSAEASPLPR